MLAGAKAEARYLSLLVPVSFSGKIVKLTIMDGQGNVVYHQPEPLTIQAGERVSVELPASTDAYLRSQRHMHELQGRAFTGLRW